MGSSLSSKKSAGGMLIEMEKAYYYSGDIVKGEVYLNLKEDFNTRGIEFTIEVIEGTNIFQKDKHHHTHWHQHHEHDQYGNVIKVGYKVLYKNTSIIANFFELDQNQNYYQNGIKLVKGHYIIPFNFKIPFNLPGSFEYYDKFNSAFIKYTISSKLISIEGNQNDISDKKLIVVRQLPQIFEYPTTLSNTGKITQYCCINQGFVTLNVSYSKNHFCPDEMIQVICTLDNTRSHADVDLIKLELFQKIVLKDNLMNISYLTKKICQNRFIGNYPAGVELTRTLELTLSDYDQIFCDQIYNESCNQFSKLQASVKSDLIECSYFIRCSLEYNFFSCISNYPSINIPIIIYIPEIERDSILEYKPDDWQPQVMPAAEIHFPEASELGII